MNLNYMYRVLEALVEHAKAKGCYKVILDCSAENVAFYEKCGLERKEVQMVRCLWLHWFGICMMGARRTFCRVDFL